MSGRENVLLGGKHSVFSRKVSLNPWGRLSSLPLAKFRNRQAFQPAPHE